MSSDGIRAQQLGGGCCILIGVAMIKRIVKEKPVDWYMLEYCSKELRMSMVDNLPVSRELSDNLIKAISFLIKNTDFDIGPEAQDFMGLLESLYARGDFDNSAYFDAGVVWGATKVYDDIMGS
jgi:hypothetical protein